MDDKIQKHFEKEQESIEASLLCFDNNIKNIEGYQVPYCNVYDKDRVIMAPHPEMHGNIKDRVDVVDYEDKKTNPMMLAHRERMYDQTYFHHGKILRNKIGETQPRIDYIEAPKIRLGDMSAIRTIGAYLKVDQKALDDYCTRKIEEGQVDKNGHPEWDPTDEDNPLKCCVEGCANFPLWKCCKEQNFLRDTKFNKVWQGCDKIFCELHAHKMWDNGDIEEASLYQRWTWFYDFERMRIDKGPPQQDCCMAIKQCCKCLKKCCKCCKMICKLCTSNPCCKAILFNCCGVEDEDALLRPNHELPVYNVGQDVFLEERKLPRLKKVLSKVRKWVGKNGLKLWLAKWKKIQSGEIQATEEDRPLTFEEYEKNFILP